MIARSPTELRSPPRRRAAERDALDKGESMRNRIATGDLRRDGQE
jgi:hypothetical protein